MSTHPQLTLKIKKKTGLRKKNTKYFEIHRLAMWVLSMTYKVLPVNHPIDGIHGRP